MQHVLVMGAGKMGQLIATWLATTGDYQVHLADLALEFDNSGVVKVRLDATDKPAISQYVKTHRISAIISCLPFYVNDGVAFVARENKCHYFDLTEDTAVSQHIREMGKTVKQAVATQCGLAPGFINILTHHLMQAFSKVENVSLRVGALPQCAQHALKYALTWSTEGLINEYANPCVGIVNEKLTTLRSFGRSRDH
jgi:saccharopine dehydrogenase-like NADP-dependent oxidoreductase